MNTFDSTKESLDSILREIKKGKIQLPDFQRGWVWDDNHIQDLLVSVAKSFPIGAIMFLQTGGEVRFQTRPVEGVENLIESNLEPEKLILDGQQRLTTLTQSLVITSPVKTRDSQGKRINRHYYFNIEQAVNNPHLLEESVIAVDENRQQRVNFGRDISLDLSSREKECQQLYFPCDQIMNSDDWETTLHEVANHHFSLYMEFRKTIIYAFRYYQIPIIELKKETPKEAVCLVFEKVNTGGVQLSVFELVTASYAAEGYNLRDDWFGSDLRNVESRQNRLEQDALLKGTEAPEFLQAITLLHTHELKLAQIAEGKTGKQVRPVSAKRADMLQLPLKAWEKWANKVEKGFHLAAQFLRKECFYDRREIPYSTQLVPLAAVLTKLGERWLEHKIYEKLARWFWSGVLGELYGGAVETRMANDYEELLTWFENDNEVPRTIRDASFQPERLDSLRSRLSAAYKAINILVIREGSQDWVWKASIKDLEFQEVSLDIHHIFPRNWCEKRGIGRDRYDSILNKTLISYKANRIIGGDAPSAYIPRIQTNKQVSLDNAEMDQILGSHALSPPLLRQNQYEQFWEDRRKRLLDLIDRAMGKTNLKEIRDK